MKDAPRDKQTGKAEGQALRRFHRDVILASRRGKCSVDLEVGMC
jgi:hypothetical protein